MKKLILAAFISSAFFTNFAYANSLDQMEIDFKNNDSNVVKFDFSDQYVVPKVIDTKSNQIHLIFEGTENKIKKSFFNIQEKGVKNFKVENINGNTHVYINLVSNYKYDFTYKDDYMFLEMNKESISYNDVEKLWKYNNELKFDDIIFTRHDNEHADIILSHNDKKAHYNITEFDGGVEIVFDESSIPTKLFQKKDVSEFSTPIDSYITKVEDGKVILKVFFNPNYKANYVTTEIGNKFVFIAKGQDYKEKVSKNKNNELENIEGVKSIEETGYNGELISFDFQDVPIKNALFLISKKMGLNLVLGDNINGNITLLLNDVPYDQALDIILKTKGLGKYVQGNVMLIAPLEEIAQRQEFEVNSQKKMTQISPLKTDTVQIKYAKSSAVYNLLDNIKSERGNIIFDERTNKMFLEDTPKKIFEMKNLVESIDIPVRQVSVEARIVYAKKNTGQEMGVTWTTGQGNGYKPIKDSNIGISNGSFIGGNGANTAGISLGFINANIDANLTALEKSGDVEIVARPLVLAADKQKSRISSGKEYPYLEISDNGDATTSFKEIVLSLDVTPQITPNNKLILDLELVQDSIAELTNAGPALDSTKIKTQVIVNNHETLVLGGVFKDSVIEDTTKVPLLGDIPYIGKALFQYNSESTEKVELLIFITPKILDAEEVIRR